MKRARGKSKKAAQSGAIPASDYPKPDPSGACPVVAIGASAGGLEVFQQFFSHMPADTGFAFVLVQHLDPSHETLIPELLAKYTKMPVQRVTQPTVVEPDKVYVIPANALL